MLKIRVTTRWTVLLAMTSGVVVAASTGDRKRVLGTPLFHQGWVTGIACVGEHIISADEGGTVTRAGLEHVDIIDHPVLDGGFISAVAVSRDGKHIALGGFDGRVALHRLNDGKKTRTLEGHAENITSIAFSPDGSRLATGSGDDTLRIWDARTGETLHELSHDNEYDVTCVAFSPDGKRVVSGDGENQLFVWDAATGDELMTLLGHEMTVTCVAFSPDGRHVVSGSWDDTLIVWDAKSGESVRTLTGHTGDVTCVTYSPDGRRVVSGSEDDTVIVWDAGTGDRVRTLRGLPNNVTCVTVTPTGDRVIAGSKVHVKTWPLP